MLTRLGKKKVPILMYHSISDIAHPRFRQFTVPPTLFAEQMAYLYQHAYTPITVTQFVRALFRRETTLPDRLVVLTFDDGFADFFKDALPVLKRYNFTATLYVSTAFIDGTSHWLRREKETGRLMLTWKQLVEISSCGIECGAHSHNHRQLDTLPNSVAQDEIVLSKKLLEDHLGQKIFTFAYPYGKFNRVIQYLVGASRYDFGLSCEPGICAMSHSLLALPRIGVESSDNLETFAAKLGSISSSNKGISTP